MSRAYPQQQRRPHTIELLFIPHILERVPSVDLELL